MQDSYAIDALDQRATSKCRIGQREWRSRIEAENPVLVILSSFWLYGVSSRFPARYVDDQSAAMPELAQSRARFERKIAETVEWLTANHRKVVIIGTTVLVDRPPSACYGRPMFSVLRTAKSSTPCPIPRPRLVCRIFSAGWSPAGATSCTSTSKARCARALNASMPTMGLYCTSIVII
jgi:hypothetical protein